MKHVANYLNYSDFKQKADIEVLPIIKEVVEPQFQTQLYKDYKKFHTLAASFSGTLALSVVITIIIVFASIDNLPFAAIVAFLIIDAILLLLNLIFWPLTLKKAKELNRNILSQLAKQPIYQKSIQALQPNWEFKNTSYVPDDIIHGYAESGRFSSVEYNTYRPSLIPSDSYIEEADRCKTVIIDGKYPAHFSNTHWIHIVTTTDSKGNTYQEKHHYYSTLLKIDARFLEDKHQTIFSLMALNGRGLKAIRLENNNFNKIFNLRMNDEIKARMMFTPLAMENLTLLHQNNFKFTNISVPGVYANNDVIYISFMSPAGFAKIDLPKAPRNKEKVTNFIYKDILQDIYSLYYLLQLVYIPNYLY
ncbi:DUF3137 domain-containing protein [Mycoplasma seminis]|uniref:DUF3137 domain-containing protein n=1 Tax=Mycoplasma seminis TaxID=512749 RepID=A0ABY9HBU8_9MOLU|nr:DUF3137 domain-containing protein [Mycoplasma seminis]WLP85843.1 DUF3137 domain-containing protein [Mycoplasma seminis]